MAKTIALKAKLRPAVGSQHARVLRADGRMPAVVYGHKEEPVAIALNLHDFTEHLHHGHRVFTVDLGDKTETLLVKALQYDHLGKYVIHADFVRVDLEEKVKVTVPIEQRGTAEGTHQGGIIDELLDHVEIECKVTEIPETIVVSITDVEVGQSLNAGEISLPDGIKLVTDPNALILHCHLVAAAKSTEESEEELPSEPEVITEKAEETEEGESEKKNN
jgi:large subunit ribosomal protein L25